MARKRRKTVTKSFGTKGRNRVRLFDDRGTLRVEFTNDEGKRKSVALNTDDWHEAEARAAEMAAALAKGPKLKPVTLAELFDNWKASRAKVTVVEAAAIAMFTTCWGSNTKVQDLDERDWSTFIEQRRSGKLKGNRQKVSDRTVQWDLKFLLSVIRRAQRIRVRTNDDGTRHMLVERNPFDGCKVPSEANPKRPITTAEEYDKLVKAAAEDTDPLVSLFLTMAHETGHRSGAVRQLRWADVDLQSRTIRFRAEFDKKGREHTVPLSNEAAMALEKAKPDIHSPDTWMFPSPTESRQPVARELVTDWWNRIEKRAGIEHIARRGWHSLRRKFATELKHVPRADLMALGGWRDGATLDRCYTKPDDATMRESLTNRGAIAGSAIMKTG